MIKHYAAVLQYLYISAYIQELFIYKLFSNFILTDVAVVKNVSYKIKNPIKCNKSC